MRKVMMVIPRARNAVDKAVIPYWANQKREVDGLLRVDKKFRAYGPEDQKREYHETAHRSGLQLPKDTVQPSRQQGQGFEKRYFLRPLRSVVLGSEQRGSRKHQKT